MQQPTVNYERNRDHRSRKRFRNLEAEKGRLNSSRARSEVPARNYKSMANLSAIPGDDSEQATAGSSISKFWKWLKHNPAKEATDATSAAPMPRKSLSKQKGGFYGNLGLGEYVGAIDDDFADEDEDDTSVNLSKQPKSRSLINISVSNLWAGEDAEIGEIAVERPPSDTAPSRKASTSTEGTGRQGLLDVITRRIATTAPPPTSLVAMFDLPGQRRVSRGEEHVEKTSFGLHEKRWGIPAYILTNDLRFHPGEQFTLQHIYDYLNELRGAMQWTQTVSKLCDDQLIFERQNLRGRRSKKLSDTTAPGAYADAETELRDLRVELACFESKTAAFLQQKKKESRASAAILVANTGRLSSVCCLLPTVVDTSGREQHKSDQTGIRESPYRLLLHKCDATLKLHPASSSLRETTTPVLVLICSDILLLARPEGKDAGAGTTYTIVACAPVAFLGVQQLQPIATGPSCISQNPSLDTSSENSINLSQQSMLPQTSSSQGDSMIGCSVSPQPPAFLSSSSGVSTASNEDLAERQSEDGLFTGSDSCYGTQMQVSTAVLAGQVCKKLDADNVLSLYWPLSHRYCLQFADFSSLMDCRSQLQCAIDQAQGAMATHELIVKVMNHVAPENCQCVHKYLRISLSVTAAKLKEQALEAFNVSRSADSAVIFASCPDASGTLFEIKLADDDRPFLLALYFASLEEQKTKTGDTKLTSDSYLHTIPRVPILPIGPEKIPITFAVRQIKPEVKKMVELQLPEIVVESPERHARRRSRGRPFSNLYEERVSHIHVLRSSRSQSSYNLAEIPKGEGERRGRSKSRPRISKAGPLSRFRSGTDNRSSTRQSGIFGQLPQDIWPDCRVSMSIMSLFVTVFYKGSLIEGIFRKCPMKSHQELMTLRVDSDDEPLSVEQCSPVLAASTLKQFFGQIPGHLLIDDYWTDWCELLQLQTDAELIAHAKMMMRRLPDVNQSLLAFLLFTLAQIRANEDTNRMSTLALATVWGPNLISRPNAAFTLEDSKIVCEIAAVLIGRVTDLFFLQQADFHRTLSRVYQDFWAQINPAEEPVPEGHSILYVEEPKSPEIKNSGLGRRGQDARKPRIIHSHSAETSSGTELPKQSPSSSSKEGFKFPVVKNHRRLPPVEQLELNSPPPIPPRVFRSSPAHSISFSETLDMRTSPVATQEDRKQQQTDAVSSLNKSTSGDETLVVSHSAVSPSLNRRLKKIPPNSIFFDLRRGSAAAHPQGMIASQSPLPSKYPICHSAPKPTGAYTPPKSPYLPLSSSSPESTSPAKIVSPGENRNIDLPSPPSLKTRNKSLADDDDELDHSLLRRSNSDVDAQLQNRYLTINRRRDSRSKVENSTVSEVLPERCFSEVTRLQKSHYSPYLLSHFTIKNVDGVNQAEFISSYDTKWVSRWISEDAAPKPVIEPSERPISLQSASHGHRIAMTADELRERFAAMRGEGSLEVRSPEEKTPIHLRRPLHLKHCNSSVAGSSQSWIEGDVKKVGRRINSLYEKNKGADRLSKNYGRPDAFMQTGTGDSTEVHLSRGSSHASTGSSCSTLIGANNVSTSNTPISGDCPEY